MSEAQAEQARLEALDRYDVLDTPREEAFDRITRLSRRMFHVPMAHVSMLDGHRQWVKSAAGFEETEFDRQETFCNQAIKGDRPLIVGDAAADPRFAASPLVLGEPHVRFYAGLPLRTSDGHNIGTFCLIDTKAREFSDDDRESFAELGKLVMDELELRRLASHDSLTNALSRRAFKEQAAREVALAIRHHHDLSLIALDIDHFKSFNDKYGHSFGDQVLARTVGACLAHLRKSDMIGRLGGEEFAVLLPHTGRNAAHEVAEKLRTTIEGLRLANDGADVRLTASFGVAALDAATKDLDTLMKRADVAVYEAKAAGRNRVVVSESAAEPAKARRRVLKGGQILVNDRKSSIDCTVRSLSEEGAGLDVYSSLGIPKTFHLAIRADGFEKACRVTERTDKHIEVEFV